MISNLNEAISASLSVEDTLDWFESTYLPELLNRINSEDSRRRLSIYGGEQIPTNERNLTDTRNRVGLILEYELARVSNELLLENGISDLFWSYTVANRFPDLEVHNLNGETKMKIEVKALQSCAEEKSANFSTLLKNINPNSDYLVVFLWEWDTNRTGRTNWDRAVKVLKIYVFHAYSIAKLRDCYWLNTPPASCALYQGFDLRDPVNCNGSSFNREEGNVGKILRLWKDGFVYTGKPSSLIDRTIDSYLKFQDEVIEAGFQTVAKTLIQSFTDETIRWEGRGYVCCNLGVFQNSACSTKSMRKSFAKDNELDVAIGMTDKYQCQIYVYEYINFNSDETKVDRAGKPKHVAQKIENAGLVIS